MKELLDGISVERLEFYANNEPPFGYTGSDIQTMARIALAVKQAQPYGYVHQNLYEAVGSCGLTNDHEAHENSSTHIPLYRVPPLASVVPDAIDANLIEALRLIQCMLEDYRERNFGDAEGWIRHINTHMSDYSEAHGDDAYSVLHDLLPAAPKPEVN